MLKLNRKVTNKRIKKEVVLSSEQPLFYKN